VTVDRQVALALGATPIAGGYTNATTVPLTFTTDADVPAANRKCGIQGGALATCGSPFAPTLPNAGSVTYVVEVTDDVGNKATATRQFTVDRTAPTASFTDGPDEGATVGTTAVTISFTTADASPKTVTCAVDGGAHAACTTATPHTLSGLSDGTHSLTVKVADAAGNVLEIKRTFAVKSVVVEPDKPVTEKPVSETGKPDTPTTPTTPTTTGGTPFLPLVGHVTSTVGTRTKFNVLRVRNLPSGSKVSLTCKGSGCPFKSRQFSATGAALDLVKALKGRRLRAGAVLEVRITGPAGELRTSRYTILRARPPKVVRA